MPSAVDTVTFQNKKSKALLTGSATQAESTTSSNAANKFGFSQNVTGALGKTVPGTNETSVIVTTPSNSLAVVAAAAGLVNTGSSENITIRVLDGSTILKDVSATIANGEDRVLSVLFIGVPLNGLRTYNVQVFGGTGNTLLLSININVSHVQLTDTHAGSSKNTNIING